jgi:hypothetical protein
MAMSPVRIGVRQTLGYALIGTRHCDRGLALLRDALELTKNSPGVFRTEVGYSEYFLGFAYWRCGDRGHASEWLERGTGDMRAEYGWDLLMYVHAMKNYARFLRENGQREAALMAEAVVNQADSVVDATTLTGMADGFRSRGFN